MNMKTLSQRIDAAYDMGDALLEYAVNLEISLASVANEFGAPSVAKLDEDRAGLLCGQLMRSWVKLEELQGRAVERAAVRISEAVRSEAFDYLDDMPALVARRGRVTAMSVA